MPDYAISAAVCSGKGLVRSNNEDNFFLNGRFMKLRDMDAGAALHTRCAAPRQVYAVMDGMGGVDKGEEASASAAMHSAALRKALTRASQLRTTVQTWVHDANAAILTRAPGGGSTLTLALLWKRQLHIAHLGDSRVYRLHEGSLSRMTEDHSEIARLIRLGMVDPADANSHPMRHAISRYLGMPHTPAVDFADPVPLCAGDLYLLCSDGVTDMLDDRTLYRLLQDGDDSRTLARSVYQAALDAGGEDNTTVMVLQVVKASWGDRLKAWLRSPSAALTLLAALLLALAMALLALRPPAAPFPGAHPAAAQDAATPLDLS